MNLAEAREKVEAMVAVYNYDDQANCTVLLRKSDVLAILGEESEYWRPDSRAVKQYPVPNERKGQQRIKIRRPYDKLGFKDWVTEDETTDFGRRDGVERRIHE